MGYVQQAAESRYFFLQNDGAIRRQGMEHQSQTAEKPSAERRRHDPSRQLQAGFAVLESSLRRLFTWFKYTSMRLPHR